MHDIGADNGGYLCRYIVTAEHLEFLRQLEISEPKGPGLPKVDMEEIRRMQEQIEQEEMCLCNFGSQNSLGYTSFEHGVCNPGSFFVSKVT